MHSVINWNFGDTGIDLGLGKELADSLVFISRSNKGSAQKHVLIIMQRGINARNLGISVDLCLIKNCFCNK